MKDVYFMGFRWEGREVRVGDVILLEAEQAEWIARVDRCWEERKHPNPQHNRRLVSLTWYYHKQDVLRDLAAEKKKLDPVSKQNFEQVWNDGNELLFSDHVEAEHGIASITGAHVVVVETVDEYFRLLRMKKPNTRVYLHRFTYEDRCKIVNRYQPLTPRTVEMVKAVEARASHGVQAAASEASIPLNRTHRGLRDVEIDRCEGKRERKARGYSRTHSSDGGKADVGISTNTTAR
jgi:hypothetical protein